VASRVRENAKPMLVYPNDLKISLTGEWASVMCADVVAARKSPPETTEVPEVEVTEPTESTATFEESVRRLGQIVERLEAGDLPLEESIALFESGVRLSREAQAKLDAAEKRVEQLLGFDENGRPRVIPIEPE